MKFQSSVKWSTYFRFNLRRFLRVLFYQVDFSDVGEPEMYNDKKEDKFGGVLTISDLCKKVTSEELSPT